METPLPLVLVIENDLMFAVRVESVLKKLGYRVKVVGDSAKAIAFATENPIHLAIVSMGRERLSPLETISRLKALQNPAPVLGFLSHTLIPQIREQAKAAGCSLLVPNSAIITRLPLLMERFKTTEANSVGFDVVEEEE